MRQTSRRDAQHRAETEVVVQRIDHEPDFAGGRIQHEAGVEAAGRDVLTRPAARRAEINITQLAVLAGNLQAHFKACVSHHGIRADEHQPRLRQVADEAQRFVGESIEYVEVIRQLVPLNTALIEHVHRFWACRQCDCHDRRRPLSCSFD